ncbi:MAG TPA: glycosyltransferase [Anaerolineae bacterium]|nr:glycosyltransferase [Anaerolineae bacterium]
MKVVWIVPGFSSDERDWCIPALLDLARVMASQCELHIVSLRYPYRRDRYSVYGATVHSIGGGHRGAWFTPSIWRAAQNVIDQLDFDVLHAWWLYEPGLLAARLKKRAPIVISLAGGELINLPSIGYGLARRFYLRWLMRWSLRRADVVTTGSNCLIEIAKKFEAVKRIEFAPLGVDTTMFTPSRISGVEASAGAGVIEPAKASTPESRVILNVGSLEPVKDQTTLLHAFKKVHDQLPNTRLIIAGEGNLHCPLSRLADTLNLTPFVEFRGEVPHHQLPDLYRSASVFVQSSRHESQGMALLEAAACGVPIVGTRAGTLSDLAPDAAFGTTIGNEDELAAAIIGVLIQPDRAAEISQAARSIIKHEYALDRSVDRFRKIYRDLTGRHD